MIEIGNIIFDALWISYQTIWSFPLTNVKWHSVTWPYTMTTPTDQTLYRTRPFTEFWVVSIEHLRRVWHADRGRLLLRTPGPVPLGLAYVLFVETNPFPNLSLFFRTMLFEYPSVLSRFYLVHLSRRLTCTIVIMRCPSSPRLPSIVVNLSHFRLLIWNRRTDLTKLDSKQILNILYHVWFLFFGFLFRADWKT